MNTEYFSAALLFYYGIFLGLCGIISVIFIGLKAKTALVSGSFSGIISVAVAHFIFEGAGWAPATGIVVSLALSGVFAWRSTKTLQKVLELIPARDESLNSKSIAFLVISLMAVVSVLVTMLQVVFITRF